ncbi:Non-specific lipid transfer protein GPI-anchored 16 [Linum grandiflorum]
MNGSNCVTIITIFLIWSSGVSKSQQIISTPCTTSMVSSFTPCINFITGSSSNGSSTSSPAAGCCDAFKELVAASMDCACLVVMANVPIQLPFVPPLSISLPRACKLGVPLRCKGIDDIDHLFTDCSYLSQLRQYCFGRAAAVPGDWWGEVTHASATYAGNAVVDRTYRLLWRAMFSSILYERCHRNAREPSTAPIALARAISSVSPLPASGPALLRTSDAPAPSPQCRNVIEAFFNFLFLFVNCHHKKSNSSAFVAAASTAVADSPAPAPDVMATRPPVPPLEEENPTTAVSGSVSTTSVSVVLSHDVPYYAAPLFFIAVAILLATH